MATVTTTYTTTAAGAGRIVAKAQGSGRQKTIPYDDAKSIDRNHGEAAGELLINLGWQGKFDALGNLTHEVLPTGQHRFGIH